MDIYILRHGKAEDAGPGRSDADRPLTRKGRDEIHAVADWILGQEISFDLIAASPLARAQETAAIVAGVLACPEAMATWKALVPGGSPDTLCAELGRYPDECSVLVVGHEPLLSSLIGRICCGDENAGIAMTRGALAKIRNYSYYRRPSGELHWLLTAKQMAGRC
jgi:phosphohistidine phosphatase